MKIETTVGRVVWFYPDDDSARGKGHPGPFSAQIASVNEDGTINLGVLDHLGVAFAAQNVPLVQDGDSAPGEAAYAAWMPFQIGQAAKTEEAQKQAGADLDAKIDAAIDARYAETLKNIEARVSELLPPAQHVQDDVQEDVQDPPKQQEAGTSAKPGAEGGE